MIIDYADELGLYITYGALIGMAMVSIYVGSFASLKKLPLPGNAPRAKKLDSSLGTSDNEEPETENLSSGNALLFPVLLSAILVFLYSMLKYFRNENVIYLFTPYIVLKDCLSLTKIGLMAIQKVFPKYSLRYFTEYQITFSKSVPAENVTSQVFKDLSGIKFTVIRGVLFILSALLVAYGHHTKNWVVSNVLSLIFTTSTIQLKMIDSFATGIILLLGIFFYDIFWVFGTNVMSNVMTSLGTASTVRWPTDLITYMLGESETLKKFAILGLGDIVIPGIYVALCLRFDRYMSWQRNPGGDFRSTQFPKPYFTACYSAYLVGLCTAFAALHTFNKSQPALMYVSPACVGVTLIMAIWRGEVQELRQYSTPRNKKIRKYVKETNIAGKSLEEKYAEEKQI